MCVDAIAGASGDPTDDGPQPGVVDFPAGPAARAHDVMVVERRTDEIGVLPVGQLDPLHGSDRRQRIKGAEDGRSTDSEVSTGGFLGQIGRAEMPRLCGDERRHVATCFGAPEAGAVESVKETSWFHQVSKGTSAIDSCRD